MRQQLYLYLCLRAKTPPKNPSFLFVQTVQNKPISHLLPLVEPLAIRAILFLLIAHLLALALLGFLLADKHRNLQLELAVSRAEVSLSPILAAMEGATLSGLEISEMLTIQRQLAIVPGVKSGIAVARMFSLNGTPGASPAGRIIFSTVGEHQGHPLDETVLAPLLKAGNRWMRNSLEAPTLGILVHDNSGQAVGGLMVELDATSLLAQAAKLEHEMIFNLLLLAVPSGMLLMIAFALTQRHGLRGGRLMLAVLLPTLIASAMLAWQSKEELAGSLQPAIKANSLAVAGGLVSKIEHALSLGIPREKLAGVPQYFDDVLNRHPDLARISLTLGNMTSEQFHAGRHPALANFSEVAIHHDGMQIGMLSVAPDQDFVDRALWAIAADIGVVLLVVVLTFRELLTSLVTSPPGAPMANTTGAGAQSVRLPLFLFILSEELTRAFLPLFFRDIAGAGGMALNTAVSLPISVYMIFFALTTPYAGGWADRFGPHRVFALGTLLAGSGFLWMAMTGNYWAVLGARALCASGYAMGTMACQRQIIATTTGDNRARGLALFVGAVSIAAICGASIGGVLAERLGYRMVLVCSAGLAGVGYLAFILNHRAGLAIKAPAVSFSFGELLPVLRNRRFMQLMYGAAIPAKISLAGFLFYLTPLGLQGAGYSPAAIGRAVMLYYILLTMSNPLASCLSDRYRRHLALVLGGMLLIGLGGMAGLFASVLSPDAAIWLGIVALGLGTGLSAAPMQALAVEVAPEGSATSVLVALRTLERLGSVIGPLLAGLLLGWLSTTGVMAAIGGLTLLSTGFLLTFGRSTSVRDRLLRSST